MVAVAIRHRKNFAGLVATTIPEPGRDKPIELWRQDEARIGQQGTLARGWATKGRRPPVPRDQRYSGACLFGAVCPARAAASRQRQAAAMHGMLSSPSCGETRAEIHLIEALNGSIRDNLTRLNRRSKRHSACMSLQRYGISSK